MSKSSKTGKKTVLVKINDKYCLMVEASDKEISDGFVEVLLADVYPKKAKPGVDEYVRLKIFTPDGTKTGGKKRHWFWRFVWAYVKYSAIGAALTLLNVAIGGVILVKLGYIK